MTVLDCLGRERVREIIMGYFDTEELSNLRV